MFKLTQTPTLWVSVPVEITLESGARHAATFKVKCKRFEDDAYTAFVEAIARGEKSANDAARELVLDWQDIADEDGQPASFTPEGFERLLATSVAQPILLAYHDARPKAKRKN